MLRLTADGKSAKEVANILHIPADQVILRVQTLLRDRDIWTESERFMLFLDDLYTLKSAIQTQVFNNGLDPKDVSNLIRVLEQLGKALDKSSKMSSEMTDRISQIQAQYLMKLIVAAYERARDLLAAEYPDVDLAAIDSAFKEGLATVVSEEDGDLA